MENGQSTKGPILPWLHPLRNRYFLKRMQKGSSWLFLGESDDAEDMYSISFDLSNLEIGSYILTGIMTGEIEEKIYVAKDSIQIEITT